MSPSLSLQFNPSSQPSAAGAGALAPTPADTDFLQALQQWLAQIQQPQLVPVAQPQAPTAEVVASDDGRALLASLLAVQQQAGQGSGSTPGGDSAPLTQNMAEDMLALLKHWLLQAGDTPAPGIGETVSAGVKPSTDGDPLPPGESLPPDALAKLSALSRQLEHWLKQAGGDAEAGNGAAADKETQGAGSQPSSLLAAALAGGVPAVPVQAANANVPDGEETSASTERPVAAGLAASLARRTEADTLRSDAWAAAASRVASTAPQLPFAGRALPDAATQSSASPATDTAASSAVPPPDFSAFSAVLDEPAPPAAPQAADTPPALPDAASAAAAQAVAQNPPGAATERPVPPPVATPVGHPGWDTEMSQRVVWMTGNSVSSAEIHLNPPHLGPVEVRISMNQDQQTSVQFLSPHAAVREALEAALPRLRDQFGAQQLTLGDVSVSQQSAGQQNDNQQTRGFQFQQQQQSSPWRGSEAEFSLADGAVLPEDGERMRPVRVGQGLLNLYV